MPSIFIWCAIGLSQCACAAECFGFMVPLLCYVCFLLPSKFCAKATRAHCSARKTEPGCCLPLMTCAPSLPEDPLPPDFECTQLWTDINGATGPCFFMAGFCYPQCDLCCSCVDLKLLDVSIACQCSATRMNHCFCMYTRTQ